MADDDSREGNREDSRDDGTGARRRGGTAVWRDMGDNFARPDEQGAGGTGKRGGRSKGRGGRRLTREGRRHRWRKRLRIVAGVVAGIAVAVGVGVLLGVEPERIARQFTGGEAENQPLVVRRVTGPSDQFVTLVFPDPGDTGFDDGAERLVEEISSDAALVWSALFDDVGQSYAPPEIAFFDGYTYDACESGFPASGPFYCPGDQTIYLDRAFLGLLGDGAGDVGRLAQIYAVSHQIAHHVQVRLGILNRIKELRTRMIQREAEPLNDRLELQADCLAGLWSAKTNLALPDLTDAELTEAFEIVRRAGNALLTLNAERALVPDAFVHADMEKRVRWFRTGQSSGSPAECETFFAARL